MAGADSYEEDISQGAVFNADGKRESCLPVAVVDTSYLASALLSDYCSDESAESRAFIQDLISKNGQIVVPQVFWYEIGNVLLNASRPRKNGDGARITALQLEDIMLLLGELPIYVDPQPTAEIRARILHIALEQNLSYYDASYLELARRKALPLKTWDAQLLQVAILS